MIFHHTAQSFFSKSPVHIFLINLEMYFTIRICTWGLRWLVSHTCNPECLHSPLPNLLASHLPGTCVSYWPSAKKARLKKSFPCDHFTSGFPASLNYSKIPSSWLWHEHNDITVKWMRRTCMDGIRYALIVTFRFFDKETTFDPLDKSRGNDALKRVRL